MFSVFIRRFKKARYIGLFALLLFLSGICAICAAAGEQETYPITVAEWEAYPSAVADAGSGVVKIITSCTDESGNTYYVHGGSGFLIGANTSEPYIFTDFQLVTPSEEDYNQIRRGTGLAVSARLTPQISVYFPEGITIEATISASGEQIGYALLKPASAMSSLRSLPIGSTADLSRKQDLYPVGYSGDFSLLGLNQLPDFTVQIRAHAVKEISHEPVRLKLEGYPPTGLAGAPVVDQNGAVVGMMSFDKEDDSLKVIPAEKLTELLTTLGIPYSNTDPTSSYNVADEELISDFHAFLSECQQDVMQSENAYSKKSLAAYKTAIAQALEISRKEDATRDDMQSALDALRKARKKLRPHNFTYRIIQSVLFLLILAFASLNIRQSLKGKRMNASIRPDSAPKKKRKQLGALIRIDTGEVIWLTKKGLRIGKNPKEVDYCIYNDPTVSRMHASIRYDGQRFYLTDHYSTNKTSINHSYIEPEKPYELFDEDTISVSDVSFHFRYMI